MVGRFSESRDQVRVPTKVEDRQRATDSSIKICGVISTVQMLCLDYETNQGS